MERLREYMLFETYLSIRDLTIFIFSRFLCIKIYILPYKDMSNKDAEKEEMKDETHEVEDTEQDEQDAENENDADYQKE